MDFKNYFFRLSDFLKAYKYIDTLIRLTQHNVIFPFYHAVSDEKLLHIGSLYRVKSLRQFSSEIDFLLKYFQPLHPEEFYRCVIMEKPIEKPSFILSFDDGLSCFYHNVAPILQSKGVSAINFLNPSFIDNKDMMYRYKISCLTDHYFKYPKDFNNNKAKFILNKYNGNTTEQKLSNVPYRDRNLLDILADIVGFSFEAYLTQVQPYLNTQQINHLQNLGFAFGAHSNDHPPYYQLDNAEQEDQTLSSINSVNQIGQKPCHFFSFPFTDHHIPASFFENLKDIHPELITFGTAGLKYDCINNHFQRIPMDIYPEGKNILTGEYIYFAIKHIIGQNRINRL